MIYNEAVCRLSELIGSAVDNIGRGPVCLMFSGGVDSALLAFLLKKKGVDFACFNFGVRDSHDFNLARKCADLLGVQLIQIEISKDVLKDVSKAKKIAGNDVVALQILSPFFTAFREIKKLGFKIIVSGLGPDEAFAGYKRSADAKDINKECIRRMNLVFKTDKKNIESIAKMFKLKVVFPYLDKNILDFAKKIPSEFNICAERKKIFRDSAENLGLKNQLAWTPKKALQYGSGVSKLFKSAGFSFN